MTVARAFLHAPKPKEPVVQQKALPAKVSRSPKSARDPRYMRAVDRLQHTTDREPHPSLSTDQPAAALSDDLRLSSVLEVPQAARISSPSDPSEREAEAVARNVVSMTEPQPAARVPAGSVSRLGEGASSFASGGTMNRIAAARPFGRPLPTSVRQFMEPRFGADFRSVRIHTGDEAAQLSRGLNAQAFTVGNQIFFGEDRFRPETQDGRELIAHELTHTLQQGAAEHDGEVGRREEPAFVPDRLQRLGFDDILDYFADQANLIPGFRMFTLVLGVNPIDMRPVERSAANVLRAVVEFMPGGGVIVVALDKYGVFDKAGAFIDEQLASLGLSGALIKASVTRFIASLGLGDLLQPGSVWDRAKAIFAEPIDRIIAFVKVLATQVIAMIKDAILQPLAQLASQSAGWDLLCAVLGKNPITGEPVPRNAETLIGGFMKLIGQEEIWENIKKANAISRAWAWFQGALEGLLGFVREVPTLLLNAIKALEIADVLLLPRALLKVGSAFAGFLERFLSWAGGTIWNLLEIVFEVAAPAVLVYVKKAQTAFKTILADPIAFVGHLIAAAKLGLSQFVSNFLSHLKKSLIGWLTGALGGAGIYLPQALSLVEIGKFVLSVLGITWQKIRAKIVKVIGDTAMSVLETGLDIVVALVTGGPAAAWEIIKEKLTNLKDMVIDAIISFVKDKIVSAAVTKLLSLLSPVGAFVQAIIGIYNTVMFFVERMKQIAQVAAAVIDAIAAIAAGIIAPAANKVEQTLGGLLTLVISFLARIVGLGNVSEAVTKFIKNVQEKVDQAIDAGIKWIVDKAKALFKSLFGKKDDRTEEQKKNDLDRGLAEADTLLKDDTKTNKQVETGLRSIKAKYRMTSLTLVVDSHGEEQDKEHVEGEINPTGKTAVETKPGAYSIFVDLRTKQIRPDINIRDKFYKKRFTTFDTVVKTAAIAGGWYRCQNTGQKGPNHQANMRLEDVTIEHTDTVVDQWNSDGRKTRQDARNAWYDDVGHLAVFCESCNKSKQAGETKKEYVRRVTITFRGPNDQ